MWLVVTAFAYGLVKSKVQSLGFFEIFALTSGPGPYKLMEKLNKLCGDTWYLYG